MNIWIIIYLCLVFMSLGIAASEHGKPQKPTNFFVVLVATAVKITLLALGGLFG